MRDRAYGDCREAYAWADARVRRVTITALLDKRHVGSSPVGELQVVGPLSELTRFLPDFLPICSDFS